MFDSPMHSYHAHHKIDAYLGAIFTAADNTYEAISALLHGDTNLARKKWESVDGEILLKMWNAENTKSEHEVQEWRKVVKPEITDSLAKPPTNALKRKVYEHDGYQCRYCKMHVFTRNKGSRILL
jgi:hypothetical protein